MYLNARHAGATDEMLFRADMVWYPALNIHYSVGVDVYKRQVPILRMDFTMLCIG